MKYRLGYSYCSPKASRIAPWSLTNHNSVLRSGMFRATETLEQVQGSNFFKLIIIVFIDNFEHIWHIVLMFVLLTLNSQMLAGILLF